MLLHLHTVQTCGVDVIVAETRVGIMMALSHIHVTTTSTVISTPLSPTHLTTVSTISNVLTTTQAGDMIKVQARVHIIR